METLTINERILGVNNCVKTCKIFLKHRGSKAYGERRT